MFSRLTIFSNMKTVATAHVVKDLAKLITSCKHAYYKGSNSVTDEDYDKLEAMLHYLCPKHPVLDVVGYPEANYKNPSIQEVITLMEIKNA